MNKLRRWRNIGLVVASIALGACGGGSGSAPSAPVQNVPPPAPTAPPSVSPEPSGLWAGTFALAPDQRESLCRIEGDFPTELNCLVFQNGSVVDAAYTHLGTLKTDSRPWQGTGSFLSRTRFVRSDLVVTGGEAVGDSITVQLLVGGHAATVDAARVANAANAAGAYVTASVDGSPVSFALNSDGSFFSQGGTCTIDGESNGLSIGKRLMQACVSNCGVPSGYYSGFGLAGPVQFVPNPARAQTMLSFALFFDPNAFEAATCPAGPPVQNPDVAYWLGGYAIK